MKTYLDKNEKEIQKGMLLFYSETIYGSDYADSIIEIVEVNGRLATKTLIVNAGGKYKEIDDKEPVDLRFSLSHFEIEKDAGGICNCMQVIPALSKDDDLMEYLEKNHSLSK